MNRSRAIRALLLCTLVLLAVWVGALWATGDLGYRPRPGPATDGETTLGYPWLGAVHVHSDLSEDASGSLEEIVAAATAVGLDFVVLAEHTRALGSGGRHRSGWYGNVLVVTGEEISTTAGHLLALGVPAHPYALGPTPRQALADIEELEGHALIAHPSGGEASWRSGWAGVDGAEVVSLYGALQRAGGAALFRALLTYPLNRLAAIARLLGAPSPAIDDWRGRTRLGDNPFPRRLAAVGAVDAHGPLWFGLPGYEAAFASVQTMVWMPQPPSPDEDGARLLAARLTEKLATGGSAVVLSAFGARPDFVFDATNLAGRVVGPGEVAPREQPAWKLRVEMAEEGPWELVLRRDGEVVARTSQSRLEFPADEAGTYEASVEASVGRTGPGASRRPGAPPWILSNPIYVWPSAVAATRVHPAPPLPPPSPGQDLLPMPGWSADSDADSHSAMAFGEVGAVWDLRVSPEEAENRFAALAWRPEGGVDWSGTRGLALALRSERPWRISLRVWTDAGDGTEQTWERVVPSSGSAPPMAALWSDFRRIAGGPAEGVLSESTGRVTGIALVVTPQRMRPGSEARIEVRALGVFGR